MTNIEQVWQAYAKGKTPAVKEKLIIHYAPLVKYVAGRLSVHLGQFMETDDLIGYGVFGLIDAIEKFDCTKGNKFETYAAFRIRGTIMDSIRSMDWVPRMVRQKSRQLEDACNVLEEELGRFPTDAEIAARLGITEDEARELMRKSAILSLVSLDDYLEHNQEPSFSVSNNAEQPEDQYDKLELKEILADVIAKLQENERLVVTLYYFEDLTLREISSIMKVSESRVSQIHTKALTKLQRKLGRHRNLLFS